MSEPEDDLMFETLLATPDRADAKAPASLKARLYTSLIRAQQAGGPLATLSDTVASGHPICVFEKLVQIAPIGERAKAPFFCHTCHARVLAEAFDNPPIFWPGCPYSEFKNG